MKAFVIVLLCGGLAVGGVFAVPSALPVLVLTAVAAFITGTRWSEWMRGRHEAKQAWKRRNAHRED